MNLRILFLVGAMVLALSSVWYSNYLASQLEAREQLLLRQGEQLQSFINDPTYFNPHIDKFEELRLLTEDLTPEKRDSLQTAIDWAVNEMPPSEPTDLALRLIDSLQTDLPIILTDSLSGTIEAVKNIPIDSSKPLSEQQAPLKNQIAEMDINRKPIRYQIGETVKLLHYGNSLLTLQLRWFPFVQLAALLLFLGLGWFVLRYLRRAEQSLTWVGMAKEAAHQLGTPTSSMMGWVELMKNGVLPKDENDEIILELENDIERLQRVSTRFSKIGSKPNLEPMALAPVIEGVAEYIRKRIPQLNRKIELSTYIPPDIILPLDRELFEWVIENLLKNALDAMDKPNGFIHIKATQSSNGKVSITVQDSGKGIDKKNINKVFDAGFTTKKRGWGLGLSLVKRIIEENHGGKIKVQSSVLNEGTTFLIVL